MSVNIMPKGFPMRSDPKHLIVMAARHRKGVQTDLSRTAAEDVRYWNGTVWVTSQEQAKVYLKPEDARDDGEKIKIWDIVPNEWMEKESVFGAK